MLVCPVCGFRNPHSNERCLKCSALLQRNEEIINRAMYEGAEKARKQYWRDLVTAYAERWQRLFDIPSWRVRNDLPYRFPFTAGGLSIVPGLGQFYNRQTSKGVVLGGCWLVFFAFCLITLRQPFSNWLLIALLICWMLIWNDAVGTAIRTNGQRWSLRNSLALVFGAMFLVGITITALQFFGLSIVSLIRVRPDVHKPLIRERDHVWVNHTKYWFGTPRVGEVIFYDPPRFTAEAGSNEYSINIKSYFQRVMGVEGDRVEKRGGEFYRNGSKLDQSEWPISGEMMPEFSVVVPRGHVLAPVTSVPQDTLSNMIGGALSGGGMGVITYVGHGGYTFPNWQQAMMVPIAQVFGKAVAVVNPPTHRQWID